MSDQDTLHQIFALQLCFDQTVQSKQPFVDWTPEERVTALVGHLIHESYEVRNALGTVITGDRKWWKQLTLTEEKWDGIHEELIDCLHFLVSAMINAGMSPHDVLRVYERKNKENHDRQARKY